MHPAATATPRHDVPNAHPIISSAVHASFVIDTAAAAHTAADSSRLVLAHSLLLSWQQAYRSANGNGLIEGLAPGARNQGFGGNELARLACDADVHGGTVGRERTGSEDARQPPRDDLCAGLRRLQEKNSQFTGRQAAGEIRWAELRTHASDPRVRRVR